MSNHWWYEPVRIALNGNIAINVNTNEQAAELLLNGWPVEGCDRSLRARQAVLRSMERPEDPGTLYAARQAFEAAAREAEILLEL